MIQGAVQSPTEVSVGLNEKNTIGVPHAGTRSRQGSTVHDNDV